MKGLMLRNLRLPALLLAAAVVLITGCKPFGLRDLLDAATRSPLVIQPSAVSVPAGAVVQFSTRGGAEPFTWSVIPPTGAGGIDSTGAYTAPLVATTATVRVTDATGDASEASVTITDLVVGLYLIPSSIEIAVNGSFDFLAISGTGSYTFGIQSAGSGTPSIVGSGSTGSYTAGGTPGIDIVEVSDGVDTVTATVTVVALSSTVDYEVTAAMLPTTGTAGGTIPAGYDFTVENTGTGDGSEDISWTVYLSADGSLGGGDLVVAEGVAPPLDGGTSQAVTFSGTYPAVAAGSYRLIVAIDAVDDTTTPNNTYVEPDALVLDPMPVDYIVPSVSHSSGTVAGASVSGTFTYRNQSLTADGVAAVSWRAYASADAAAGANDFLLDSGSEPALAAGATSSAISFSGTWPTTPGAWYLVVEVSAADDIDAANDDGSTATAITVTGGVPPNIDYLPQSLGNSGAVAGYAHTGSFTVKNQGTADGSQTVYWTAYRSGDSTLDILADTVIDSGTTSALGAGATSSSIAFDGTWPSPAATWYLFVAVSAADDVVSGNNQSTGLSVVTTPPNVNYDVVSVSNTGGTTAGGALDGSFTVQNIGTYGGSYSLSWIAYRSTDAILSTTTDAVIDSGVEAPLAAGGSRAVGFSSTWPPATGTTSYWLFVVVTASDDVNSTDDSAGTTAISVTLPDVNYDVLAVNHTSGTIAGSAVNGTFTIRNVGTADGARTVSWRAYASADATPGANDFLLQSGTTAILAAGATSSAIGFTGTWPTTPGDWYLAVEVAAADDIDATNDGGATATPITVTGAAPLNIDYVVNPISNTGTLAGFAHAGTFTVKNQGTVGGSQTVFWTAYRSSDITLDVFSDTIIDSGTTSFLGAGITSATISFDGTWPTPAQSWYLFVAVSAADDINTTNNQSLGLLVVTTVPNVNYDVLSVTNTGGTTAGGALDGSFTVQNIGTDAGTQAVTWIAYLSTDASLSTTSDPVIDSGIESALGGGASAGVVFSSTWPVKLTPQFYWLFVVVAAGDDVSSANNTEVSAVVNVIPPDVNYDIISVTNTGALVAGGALAGTFELKNIGTSAGSHTVYWTVYRSANASYNAGTDPLIDAGSVAGGLAVSASVFPTFAGTWPEDTAPQTWYYIVRISANDDTTIGNDEQASSGYLVIPPAVYPDYTVTAASVQTTGSVGAPLLAPNTFQVQNATANAGTKAITWRVYASRDVLLDGADTQVATGTTAALAGGGNSGDIAFGGTWPSIGARYRLIVSLDADDDTNPSNDTWVSAAIEVPQIFLESDGPALNGDYGPTPTNPMVNFADFGLVLLPGQLVRIDGTMDAKYYLDTYKVALAAGATRLHLTLRWSTGSDACNLYLWDTANGEGYSSYTTNDVEDVTYIGLTPLATYYTGVYFLENKTGTAYQLWLEGQP